MELPKKYQKLWQKCSLLLEKSRKADLEHARETVNLILSYKGDLTIDKDILIPVAMMHDIGHIAILPEHFKYVTGPKKITNGKLVHMLAGAKIAKDVLESVKYDGKKSQEIVDIISMHDSDALKGIDWKKVYNTKNKKLFHDFDRLDRFSQKRISNVSEFYKSKADKENLRKVIFESLDLFFYKEFKETAKQNFQKLDI